MPDNVIAQARRERRWSQLRLLHQLRLAGQAAGVALPDDATLRITLSGWENGRHKPGKVYQPTRRDAHQQLGHEYERRWGRPQTHSPSGSESQTPDE
jgi:hypothetical protein